MIGAVKKAIATPFVAAVGMSVMADVESAVTDLQIGQSQWNHALTEGADVGRPSSEREFIDRALRDAWERQYWAPQVEYTFTEDFCYHLGDAYDHYPSLFQRNDES